MKSEYPFVLLVAYLCSFDTLTKLAVEIVEKTNTFVYGIDVRNHLKAGLFDENIHEIVYSLLEYTELDIEGFTLLCL